MSYRITEPMAYKLFEYLYINSIIKCVSLATMLLLIMLLVVKTFYSVPASHQKYLTGVDTCQYHKK